MKNLWRSHARALDVRLGLEANQTTTDGQSMLNFVRKACRWAAAALNDVQAKIDDDTYIRLVRGLWTGWRSTMYINVTFNYAYTTAQRLMFIKKFGVDPLSRYNVLGDDMEGDSPSLWTALKFVSLIDPLGLDAQASKQMVSMRRAEFLRLMYRDGETISGSYCRGITGFTSGDTQTSPRYAGVKATQNVCSGINRLIRRGGEAERLEKAKSLLVRHWSAIRVGNNIYRPSADVLRSPTWMGGMGVCRHDGRDARFVAVKSARTRKPRFSQKNSQLSKLMIKKGWHLVRDWNSNFIPTSSDVDMSVMARITPAAVKKEYVTMEREDTIAYYRQRGVKFKQTIVPQLWEKFYTTHRALCDKAPTLPKVAYKPNDWWKGLVRDAMGPLAAHPQAERLMGRAGPQKLRNVLSSVTANVVDAKTKLLSIDEETRMATVNGNLETPSPLAGLVSPLSRHLVALCHSHIVEWLCIKRFRTSMMWNRSIVNALYTFEKFFLHIQMTLVSKYRV
jgi:hypothetical protein